VGAGQGLEFTEASEFARSIQLREPEEAASRPADSTSHMGVEETQAASDTAGAPEPLSASVPPPKRNSRSKSVPVSLALLAVFVVLCILLLQG